MGYHHPFTTEPPVVVLEREEEAVKRLTRLAEPLAGHLTVEPLLGRGSVANEILRIAEQRAANLILRRL